MDEDPPAWETSMLAVVSRLRVDAWTAEAVRALCVGGVDTLLLKGPAVSRWLYPRDAAARPYVDVDLLVGPQDLARAGGILESLDYAGEGPVFIDGDRPHARPYRRVRDGATVDLHRVLHGMENVAPAEVWRVVSKEHDTLSVGGVDVSIPSIAVRTLHLALHLSPGDERGSKVRSDLERAVEVLDITAWESAASVAKQLGVEAELGHRLRRLAATRHLAAALRLPDRETALHAYLRVAAAGTAPPGTLSMLQLHACQGARARAAYALAKLFPPEPVLRDRDPAVRSGAGGLTRARVRWLVRCVARLPAAVIGWRRARRAAS